MGSDFMDDVSHSGDIDQILATIIADDQRVHTVHSVDVATNDKFLAAIHPILDPGARPFSRLVEAVSAFRDDAFGDLLSNHGEMADASMYSEM